MRMSRQPYEYFSVRLQCELSACTAPSTSATEAESAKPRARVEQLGVPRQGRTDELPRFGCAPAFQFDEHFEDDGTTSSPMPAGLAARAWSARTAHVAMNLRLARPGSQKTRGAGRPPLRGSHLITAGRPTRAPALVRVRE
jgi:hypothetical protein